MENNGVIGVVLAFAILFAMMMIYKFAPEIDSLFREWGKTNPRIPSSLFTKNGVILGKYYGATVGKPKNKDGGNVMVVGGVGSGKSAGIAIPTLLAWDDRAFVIDIKGELYDKAGKWKPIVKKIDPLDEGSFGYNPYHVFSFAENLVQEAQAISNALVPKPQDIRDPFWVDCARNLLTGAILHFFKHYECTFTETINEILSLPAERLVEEIKNSSYKPAIFFINSFVGMDIKTLSGIYTELSRHILLYITDEHIKNCLSKENYVTPDDLEHTDVYVVIHEHLLEQWKNFLTLIVTQFLTAFEKRPDRDAAPVLFLLDEFPRLGKIEKITSALATLRSKNITTCLILQSLAQLDMIYGHDTRVVICGLCSYTAVLSATSVETQEYFSKLVGSYYPSIPTVGKSYNFLRFPISTNDSSSPQKREIIRPEAFATLPIRHEVILLTPHGFFKAKTAIL